MSVLALMVLATTLAAPPAQIIELDSGEYLRATVVEETTEYIVIDHPVLGQIQLPLSRVKSIRPAGDEPLPAPPAPPAPPPAPETPRWKTSFDLGFSGSAGNTQNVDLRLALTSAYKDPTQSYLVDASFYIRTASGDISDNRTTAGFLGDWPIQQSRWSWFSKGRFDMDEFQSWDQRFTGGGGLGYLLIDQDTVDDKGNTVDALTLRALMGLGFRKEWGSLNDEIAAEVIAGLTTTWRLSDRQNLIAGAFVYPTIAGPSQFRVTVNGEWVMSLADLMDGLNLKFGLSYEYQQEIDPGRDHNDLIIYTALGIAF